MRARESWFGARERSAEYGKRMRVACPDPQCHKTHYDKADAEACVTRVALRVHTLQERIPERCRLCGGKGLVQVLNSDAYSCAACGWRVTGVELAQFKSDAEAHRKKSFADQMIEEVARREALAAVDQVRAMEYAIQGLKSAKPKGPYIPVELRPGPWGTGTDLLKEYFGHFVPPSPPVFELGPWPSSTTRGSPQPTQEQKYYGHAGGCSPSKCVPHCSPSGGFGCGACGTNGRRVASGIVWSGHGGGVLMQGDAKGAL